MLVLTRKSQETIVLSSGVVFKVLGIERGRVRVGIAAPEGMRILRGECAAGQMELVRQSSVKPSEAGPPALDRTGAEVGEISDLRIR